MFSRTETKLWSKYVYRGYATAVIDVILVDVDYRPFQLFQENTEVWVKINTLLL